MIKRLAYILISAVMLFTTTGLIVSKHYCHGQLVSVSYGKDAESCCKSGTCCHNEVEFHQLKENYISSITIDKVDFYELLVVIEYYLNQELINADFVQFTDFYSGSPPTYNLHTFLSTIQNFRL